MSEEKKMWKSLEQLKGLPDRQDRVHPANNSFLSRREFMEWTSGMVAVLGASACTRMPQQKILPYHKQPERVIPGKALFFATTLSVGSNATGVLVESHMGRPTKVEGNPDHPASLGTSDAITQGHVLSLYDPDRSTRLLVDAKPSTWETVSARLNESMQGGASARGEGIRILTEPVISPTLAAQIAQLGVRFPGLRWHQYEPVHRDAEREGAIMAFGEDVVPVIDFTQAKVVVALDSDFLSQPATTRYAHDFAKGRQVLDKGAGMNRLYAVEPSPTITGIKADHRLIARASRVQAIAAALAKACGVSVQAVPDLSPVEQSWVQAAAQDLVSQAGVVVVGRWQSPLVHALAHAIHARVGSVGKAVRTTVPVELKPEPQVESIRRLVADMQAGRVETLIILGGNPVYNAPGDLPFSAALAQVKNRIHCGLYQDETAELCNVHIPEAHALEQWSDARTFDGTLSLVQPLIAPMYGGKSHHEVVAAMAGDPLAKGYDIVRDFWRGRWGAGFDKNWNKALHDGVIAGSASNEKRLSLRSTVGWAPAPGTEGAGETEILFRPAPFIYDGRFANNGWLQEVPHPVSKVTWDNAVYMSSATAAKLGLANESMAEVSAGSAKVKGAVWQVPGQAEGSVTLHLGYGRERAGRLGTGAGFNAGALRAGGAWQFAGAALVKSGGTYRLATTQMHHSMEGRAIVRHTHLKDHLEHPHWAHHHEHLPPALKGQNVGTAGGEFGPKAPADYQWGMAINLSSCTGCNACVVACQAENNIPVVGKKEVLVGREMHWIRVDRYFEGPEDNPQTHFQPVACVQCETAPCEVVCPVGATVHDNEGLNNMVYNRCVGTKYCSNNCPYKVRRFNFYEYTKTITPTTKMVQNPNVTVRSRGIMEKCTYCVQRISSARVTAKNEGRKIRDGEIRTACQSACPSQSIVFGDISDPTSLVSMVKASPQNYGLLEDLNTRPRTTYLGKVVNPSPSLESGEPA